MVVTLWRLASCYHCFWRSKHW